MRGVGKRKREEGTERRGASFRCWDYCSLMVWNGGVYSYHIR